jgi:hypothetical protein
MAGVTVPGLAGSNELREANEPIGYVARVQGQKELHARSPLSVLGERYEPRIS